MNVGEELVASYLQNIFGCDFTQKNLYIPYVQGEIDVVGINLKDKKVYVCEVAIHLTTGLQYVKDGQPNNVRKLTEKFSRDIEYTNKYFSDYEKHFMLWSPIIKKGKANSKHNQQSDLNKIAVDIKKKYEVEVEFIVNDKFMECFKELRAYASKKTEELKCPVLRLLQIEESLSKHVEKMRK